MKFAARKRGGGGVINLTPLIDCMFLLVIFIMIAARFEPEAGIDVDLPAAASSGEVKRPERIDISISVEGEVFLGGDLVAVEDLDRLIVEARTLAGDPEGKEVILVINGDKGALHGRVVEVMDAAARAKHQKVTIRTTQ